MALSSDQLATIRDEIGTAATPTDADLDVIHDRVSGLVGVVRAVWAQRLANMLAEPATFSVSGEYSQSVAANIEAIRKRLSELALYPDDSDTIPPGGVESRPIGSYQLVRPDCDR